MGYEYREHADFQLIKTLKTITSSILEIEKERNSDRVLARQAEDKIKNYNKIYFDKRHYKLTMYNIDDYVLIRDTNVKPGEEKKFKPVYKGPYQVAKVLNKNRYVITDIPGFNVVARPYNSILLPDRMKPWIKAVHNSCLQ